MSSLLDKIVGFFTGRSRPAETERWDAGQIDDEDVRNLDDLNHHYPLPEGYEFATDINNRPMVVRTADGASANFLVQNGLLTFYEPYPHKDGPDRSQVIEVPKRTAPPI